MILITGASGLVGNAIFDNFKEKGLDILGTCFSNRKKGLVYLDLIDQTSVRSFFEKNNISVVVHCAAIIPGLIEKRKADATYLKNQTMIRNILSSISRDVYFILISSTALYDLTGDNLLTEESPCCCNTPYSTSKKACEDELLTFYHPIPMYLILRISSPYSEKNGGNSILCRFIKSAHAENKITLWGSGNRCQAFTNVDKMADDLLILISKKVSGIFNYVTTPSISMKNLAEKVQHNDKKTSILFDKSKNDPEEQNRTIISTDKINLFVKIHDTIDRDIKALKENLVQ